MSFSGETAMDIAYSKDFAKVNFVNNIEKFVYLINVFNFQY